MGNSPVPFPTDQNPIHLSLLQVYSEFYQITVTHNAIEIFDNKAYVDILTILMNHFTLLRKKYKK